MLKKVETEGLMCCDLYHMMGVPVPHDGCACLSFTSQCLAEM